VRDVHQYFLRAVHHLAAGALPEAVRTETAGRSAVLMLARLGAGIEAAGPAPRIFVEGNARANFDRAGVDVAPIDVPAFLRGISRSAAGEFGHAPLKRGPKMRAIVKGRRSNPLPPAGGWLGGGGLCVSL
jgi:hypothetical protein